LIKYDELETVFRDRLIAALKNVFDKYFNEDANYRIQSNNFFTVKNLPENQLAFVKYYLLFGRAPWWANSTSINFNNSILLVINNSASEFRKLLYEIGRDESVRKRLAFSLEENIIKKVIHVLEPSQSEYIFQYHSTVTKLNRAKQTVKAEEKVFNRSLWYVILTYIIYNRGGIFNRREFLKQNLYNVSTLYNVNYIELISLLYKGIKENQSIKNNSLVSDLFDDIFYLAQESKILEFNIKPATNKFDKNKLNDEVSLKEQLAVLNYFLERGSFPVTSFHYSRNDIIALLDFFINYHSDLFIRYLKSTNFDNQMINRLFNLLPTSQFNQLINLITPSSLGIKIVDLQKSFILFLLNKQLSTQILISSEFKISILFFIINNNYSITFSKLFSLFLTRISTKLQISYTESFALYDTDLKRQIQIQEFNLNVLQKISNQIELLRESTEMPISIDITYKDDNERKYYGIANLLKFLILRGYIPWWGKEYLSKSLDKLMMDLFSINPKEAIAIFYFASSQMMFRNRFIQFFSEEVTIKFLQYLWKNENDWKLYFSLESLLKSLPLKIKQPSDEDKTTILLHSFWKTLIDGNFSFFNSNRFIQLNFLLLKKYHSFEINEFISFLSSNNSSSFENDAINSSFNYIEILNALNSFSFDISEEDIVYDSTISVDIWFELVVNTIIFVNKKISKSRKIKEIETVINYFLKNLTLPSYLLGYVKEKQSIFFSFLLDYYYSLDRNKYVQFINVSIDSINIPSWLRTILDDNQNKYNLVDSNLLLSPINSFVEFDSILLKEVYKISNLSKKLKIKLVSEILNFYLENLTFPTNIIKSINNREKEMFLYFLSILYSLDNRSHRLLLEKYANNSNYPEWLISVFKSNSLFKINDKIDQYYNFEDIVKFVVFDNKELSPNFELIQIEKFIDYFIKNLSFPTNFPEEVKKNQSLFFSFLMRKLFSLSQNRFKEIFNESFFTSKPTWFKSVISETIQDLNLNIYNNISFEQTIKLIIFENKELSPSLELIQIEKFIDFFIKNLSFPTNFPEEVKKNQSLFFSFLMRKLYSLSQNRFKEIFNESFFTSKPTWFKSVISETIQDLNLNIDNNKSFEETIKFLIYGNKDNSSSFELAQIEKFIVFFIKNLSFPTGFPEYIKNNQNSFFSFLMSKLYSFSQKRFKEIVDESLFLSKPIWFENLIKKIIKELNILSFKFFEQRADNLSPLDLFENDDIFISTLLGFKPSSNLDKEFEIISNESFNLLIYLLTNNKLPNKYESLNRYDSTFLITILLRYIYVHNINLFNQFLVKFSSLPYNSRMILFKFFLGKSNHPTDLLISERLIPFMNGEIDLQNKNLDIVIKSDKISINVSNKLNEWINSESSLAGLSRQEKLFQLLSYFLLNGKLYESFSTLSGNYLYEFLRILIFEIEKIDYKKILLLLSNENNDPLTSNLVLNLFSKGDTIEERRVHSLLQSIVPKVRNLDINLDDFHEFDVQFIDTSNINIPLNNLDLKEFFLNSIGNEKISDQLLLENSITILIYFLIHKKREPQFIKISDNHFLIYLKEIVGFIFLKKPTTLRELIENPIYPIANKLAVFSLFSQTYDSKQYAIKIFLQPIIEAQIFKHIELIVKLPITTFNFKDAINTIIKSKLSTENINVLKLLQFIESADLIDELTQSYLSDLVSKNMDNYHSAYLKQILSLFNSSLANFQDRNELSNLFVRFNSYILYDLKSLVSLDIYLRRLIQFLLYQNRPRALYFFSKFLIFTQDINFNFSSEYFFIINKLRKLFSELVSASDIVNSSEVEIKNRDKPLIDKVNEVVSDFLLNENKKVEEVEDLNLQPEDYKESDDPIYINNAGLVLFNPYITTFLSKLGMTEKGKFKDEESTFRSVHLLQLLVTEATYEEHELVLNKILCNLPVSSAVPMNIELKASEKQLAKELIEVTMKRWKKGSSGSKESFRASFINRDGRLSMINEEWHLKVDKRGYDVILQTLPWSYGMIKLPWMLKPLIVEWI
jgi:hypothetical protein